MVSFFHAYDLRGKYPEQISERKAERLGKAYGTYAHEKVLVARDGRSHAEKITNAFNKGIKSTGTDIIDIGVVPTPVAYFAVRELGLKDAAVVTASHNPPEYTGFKFAKEDALAMSREGGMEEIEKIYEQENFETGSGAVEEREVKQNYVDAVAENFDVNLDIIVNYGNGVASNTAGKLLEKIGCRVEEINNKIDGSFPNHLPDPQDEAAQNTVKEQMNGQDLGIIFDGDGDRAGFIYEGKYIPEDKVLALFTEEILSREEGAVIHDLRASKLVKECIEKNGGKPIESKVGHTFISEKIHREPNAVFAGELSGHYYFPGLGFPWDDGMISACLMCQILEDGGIEKLESYPDYPVSPELRIDCTQDKKRKVIERLSQHFSDQDIDRKDGLKIEFENGWALIRPSNTEEKMSVRCEADTEKDLEDIRSRVESKVRSLC